MRGILVTGSYSTISRTLSSPTAYSSPPIMKVRYCWTPWSRDCCSSLCVISMCMSFLEPGETAVGRVAIRLTGWRKRGARQNCWFGFRRHALAGAYGNLFVFNTEESHELRQGFGLRCQFFGRAGKLLRGRGVTLRNGVNGRHRLINLRDTRRLLAR